MNDIHNKYPKIDKYFNSKKECIGEYIESWDCYRYMLRGKVVALLSTHESLGGDFLNLKILPEDNFALRDLYEGIIIPGYHQNKIHWSTIVLKDKDKLPSNLIYNLIDTSYNLIFTSFSKKIQKEIIES